MIPDVLKRVPLALSFQTLLHLYWPGAMMCCEKKFTSTRCYGLHLYKSHIHPSPPPKLSILPSKTFKNKQHPVSTKIPDEISESESYSSFPEAAEEHHGEREKMLTQLSCKVSPLCSPNARKKSTKQNNLGMTNCTPSSSSDIVGPDTNSPSKAHPKARRRPLSIYCLLTLLLD